MSSEITFPTRRPAQTSRFLAVSVMPMRTMLVLRKSSSWPSLALNQAPENEQPDCVSPFQIGSDRCHFALPCSTPHGALQSFHRQSSGLNVGFGQAPLLAVLRPTSTLGIVSLHGLALARAARAILMKTRRSIKQALSNSETCDARITKSPHDEFAH